MSGLVGDNTARASGVIASAGGGAILQVQSVAVTSTISVGSSTTPVAITAFDIAFTPTADTSKLCLQASLSTGGDGYRVGGYFYDSTGAAIISPIGDAGGSRQRVTFGSMGSMAGDALPVVSYTAWFTPGDTTTRTLQVWGACSGAGNLYINRTGNDTNNNTLFHARDASTFTITEYDGSLVTLT